MPCAKNEAGSFPQSLKATTALWPGTRKAISSHCYGSRRLHSTYIHRLLAASLPNRPSRFSNPSRDVGTPIRMWASCTTDCATSPHLIAALKQWGEGRRQSSVHQSCVGLPVGAVTTHLSRRSTKMPSLSAQAARSIFRRCWHVLRPDRCHQKYCPR